MAFSCLPQLTHLLFSLRAPQILQFQPVLGHKDLVLQAPHARNGPPTFPTAPSLHTSAFSPSLVNGAAHRAHVQKQHAEMYRSTTPDPPTNADGTSWEPSVLGVDGWNVGFEKATQMFVKRKGRGAFRFEESMVEGSGKEEGLVGDSLLWRAEGREGRARLGDGFAYREWVEQTEGVNVPVDNETIAEATVEATSDAGGSDTAVITARKEIREGFVEISCPVEIGRRKGMDGWRDSVLSSLYLTQGA